MFEVRCKGRSGQGDRRETIPGMRKNVAREVLRRDISRKRKLLEKQKEGKRRIEARRAG